MAIEGINPGIGLETWHTLNHASTLKAIDPSSGVIFHPEGEQLHAKQRPIGQQYSHQAAKQFSVAQAGANTLPWGNFNPVDTQKGGERPREEFQVRNPLNPNRKPTVAKFTSEP